MEGQIIKSYVCQGKYVNILFVKSKNCYVIESEGQMFKVFSAHTAQQNIETFAMNCITKLTNKEELPIEEITVEEKEQTSEN